MQAIGNFVRAASLVLAAGLLSAGALAQESGGKERTIILAPYLWATGINGTSTVAPLPPLDIDAGFSDILDNANFAMSLHTEFWFDKWGFVIDPTYISLEMEPELPAGVPLTAPTIEVDIWIVELWAGYHLNENWDLIGGARYQDQDLTMSGLPSPPLPVSSASAGDDWTDWFVGFRYMSDISEKWFWSLRSDITVAGDSDTGFNAAVYFNRRFGDNKALNLGYRYFENDFSSSAYGWDVTQDGPVIGYTWKF
jgi:hypothetical protein